MDRLRAFWNRGWLGKAVLSIAGLLLACCVIGIFAPRRPTSPSANLAAQPTAAQPTEIAATDTPEPTRAPRATRTPKPTETLVPTFTPEPTFVTDAAGVDPVNGDCPAHYRIKVSSTGVAHDLDSRTYKKTNPVHCYATMKDVTNHGYRAAQD